jgi:hypothetical protein
VKIIVGSAQTASGVSTVALLAPPSLSDIILIAGQWLIAPRQTRCPDPGPAMACPV